MSEIIRMEDIDQLRVNTLRLLFHCFFIHPSKVEEAQKQIRQECNDPGDEDLFRIITWKEIPPDKAIFVRMGDPRPMWEPGT